MTAGYPAGGPPSLTVADGERWIDLRSDTVTQPSLAMREAMFTAALKPFAGERTILEIPKVLSVRLRPQDPQDRQRQNYPAFKMPDGSVSVRAELVDSGAAVRIAVSDTGPGISEDGRKQLLFESCRGRRARRFAEERFNLCIVHSW